MANWKQICTVDECPVGEAREFVVEERIVALFHTADGFHALDGMCPHQGGPLGQGRLTGDIITCPWHGWQFHVCTGQHQTSASLTHPGFPVKVEADGVFVDLDA